MMGHTKSAKIRSAARSLAAQGKPPRPKEIVEILAKEGVRVLSSQVSTALRGTDLALTKPPSTWNPDAEVSVQDLAAVRELLRRTGSMEKALKAVAVYRSLITETDNP